MKYGVLQDFTYEGKRFIEGQEIDSLLFSNSEFNVMIEHGKVAPILGFAFRDSATGSVTFDGEDIIKNIINEDEVKETEVKETEVKETETEDEVKVKIDVKSTVTKPKRGKRN